MKRTKQKLTFKVNYDDQEPTLERDDDPEGKSFGEAKKELLKYYQTKVDELRAQMKSIRSMRKEEFL